MSKGSYLLIVCCALLGCAAALPQPESADVAFAQTRWPDATARDLDAGRELYTRKCSGCHQLFLPSSRPPDAWPRILQEMSSEAKMSQRESELVERYLVTLSQRANRSQAR